MLGNVPDIGFIDDKNTDKKWNQHLVQWSGADAMKNHELMEQRCKNERTIQKQIWQLSALRRENNIW